MWRRLLVIILVGFVSAPAGAVLPEKLGGRDYVDAALLLSREDADVRLAAKTVARLGASPAILDLTAEVAWTGCTGRREMDPDALAWLAVALGNSKDARYAAFLDDCLARTTDKKVAKYLTLARQKIDGTATASFAGGAVDLEKLRARFARDSGAASRQATAAGFRALRRAWTLDETFAAVGLPVRVTAVDVHEEELEKLQSHFKSDISGEMIVLAYPETGSVRFSTDDGGKAWVLVDAASERNLHWLSPSGRLGEVSELIAEGNGRILREYSQRLLEKPSIDAATLDLLARRIDSSRSESDSDTVDALAYLCKVLGKSGNGKYRSLLLEVADTASRRSLRKHARLAAESLPDGAAEKPGPAE